jgi:uncharacterized protein (TIGR01244 family)
MLLMAAVSGASADEGQSLASPVNRLHRVDDRLYRGAQPTDEGFRHLRDLGVKTVINLRLAEDAEEIGEQRIVESFGMRYVNIPVRDGNFFTWFRRIPDESVHAFLQAVDGAEPGPVFVHCRRGTDRTGAMVAFYRIARSGWEQARAVKEAEDVGMRPWYRGLRRQIKAFEPTTAVRTSQ